MKDQDETTITIEMIDIPSGTFLMGSKLYDDSQPIHEVAIAAFQMGKYPITQAQWQAVMGSNPSRFKGADRPVESVSWNDAQEFCRKLSAQTGKAYRLPTEAEWEYACRAGRDGDWLPSLDEGWYWKNAKRKTHPVGEKQPNAFGLYDMHGNVWEWCEDEWRTNYSSTPDEQYRVLRGGSWLGLQDFARAVYRYGNHPVNRDVSLGFRVVLGVRPPFAGGLQMTPKDTVDAIRDQMRGSGFAGQSADRVRVMIEYIEELERQVEATAGALQQEYEDSKERQDDLRHGLRAALAERERMQATQNERIAAAYQGGWNACEQRDRPVIEAAAKLVDFYVESGELDHWIGYSLNRAGVLYDALEVWREKGKL